MHSLTLAIRFITIKSHDKFDILNGGGICLLLVNLNLNDVDKWIAVFSLRPVTVI